MKSIKLSIIFLSLSLSVLAGDSTKVAMAGTYTTTEGKAHAVYLNPVKSKLFYERVRGGKVFRVYFLKVKI